MAGAVVWFRKFCKNSRLEERNSCCDPECIWSCEITYAADGSAPEEIRYECEEDEDGESIGSKGYRYGKLFKEVQVIRGAGGETTGTLWIDYHEDGGKTVAEYSDTFDLVRKTIYGAVGNVIRES